ncbi:putative phospholipase B-like 2 [Puma concolor]|uniref:Phospholipase B-like n=1 Tax=Puma concolor TaxID=9696 RepID=A0A6P6IMT3_PUMCO|nr:putative phospholipase B-like 2 [Puma concolor]
MVAPMYGSPGGRLARALTRALALALVLALLVGLFLSGLTGAIPISGRQWGPDGPVPPASRSRSVLLDAETGQLRLVDGRHPDAVAWANLTNAIRETGWAFLELRTNGRYNDSLQAYAAGVVEAAVSEELIYMHWVNTVVNYCGPFEYEVGYCEKLKNFLETNLEWMQEQMQRNKGSAYWHQVRLTLLQLKGLEDSYESSVTFPTGRFTIKPLGFLLLQLAGDLGDLEPALNKTKSKHVMGSGSCSALIKLLPGQSDLLIAHNTWSSYQNMLRIIKKYWFQFREDPQGATRATGSCQWKEMRVSVRWRAPLPRERKPPSGAFRATPVRVLAVALGAKSSRARDKEGTGWEERKKAFPPGRCYHGLNRKAGVEMGCRLSGERFDRLGRESGSTGAAPWALSGAVLRDKAGCVIVKPPRRSAKEPVTLETTIGNRNPALWKYVQPKDSVLEWVRNVVANRLALDGDAWADIFQKFNSGTYNNQWMIVDYKAFVPGGPSPRSRVLTVLEQIPGMVVVADKTSELYQKTYWASYNIPYNDFLHDPLSLCKACSPQANAENAISARSDLNPANGSYPFQALQQRSHGGIDVKVTSMALAKAFQLVAASGPTWDQLPPFQWSASPFSGLLHMGQPDLWKFSPIEVRWD